MTATSAVAVIVIKVVPTSVPELELTESVTVGFAVVKVVVCKVVMALSPKSSIVFANKAI